jgi:flavorubredoxin
MKNTVYRDERLALLECDNLPACIWELQPLGWGGRMVEQLAGMIPNLKVEILDPVVIKGYPKEADFEALDRLADGILSKHKQHGIT